MSYRDDHEIKLALRDQYDKKKATLEELADQDHRYLPVPRAEYALQTLGFQKEAE